MALFELTRASIGYNGTPVLHEITLQIEAGERVAFVGPSGAGKSTLLSTLFAQQRERAALVPQEYALVKNLSVFHNVYMGRLHRHSSAYNLLNLMHPLAREIEAVRPVVSKLGLEELLGKPVGELSGGQQQRTAVGRALFQGGEVLLGDEPVSSVDPLQSRRVLEAINAAFPTVVLAMHDVGLALDFTDRLIGLKGGRVEFDRPTQGLRAADLDAFYHPA
ncbi:MAG TPA: ATP-binding cassette domain-containing protein [bacterium]|nr:ATP-binding cassette domain-containing protein [bacterium]